MAWTLALDKLRLAVILTFFGFSSSTFLMLSFLVSSDTEVLDLEPFPTFFGLEASGDGRETADNFRLELESSLTFLDWRSVMETADSLLVRSLKGFLGFPSIFLALAGVFLCSFCE